jgi:hypothetical protein
MNPGCSISTDRLWHHTSYYFPPTFKTSTYSVHWLIQNVPLATEPDWLADRCSASQQLGAPQTHTTDTYLFISHTTNVPLFKFLCNILIGVRIIKEMPGSVASGTHCILKARGWLPWNSDRHVLLYPIVCNLFGTIRYFILFSFHFLISSTVISSYIFPLSVFSKYVCSLPSWYDERCYFQEGYVLPCAVSALIHTSFYFSSVRRFPTSLQEVFNNKSTIPN